MGYSRTLRSIPLSLGLVLCGLAANVAWYRGLWGSLTGVALATGALSALNWRAMRRRPEARSATGTVAPDATSGRLLLDAAPTPMVAIERGHVRALNRAARRLFATDDRVLPPPTGLVDSDVRHIRHEGRSWRVDRVTLDALGDDHMVVALIDIEQEERTAEARAAAEMIHVLGHELMNGLAPIVSLAESGEAALDRTDVDLALLREILGTVARRAEGLHRFTEAYRELARLPEPSLRPVPLESMLADLSRLFVGRWSRVSLEVEAAADIRGGGAWLLDRDQLTQALWALLQNAAEAATSAGHNRPQVSLAVRLDEAGLTIEVRDNGPGIPPDSEARIFRPFHTTKPGGTGVGLSLARQIAHAHGGSLALVSGSMTIFRLLLPNTLMTTGLDASAATPKGEQQRLLPPVH